MALFLLSGTLLVPGLVSILLVWSWLGKKSVNLPPGPKGWPLIGVSDLLPLPHLHLLTRRTELAGHAEKQGMGSICAMGAEIWYRATYPIMSSKCSL